MKDEKVRIRNWEEAEDIITDDRTRQHRFDAELLKRIEKLEEIVKRLKARVA